jgi:hypothetical protein
MMFPGLKSSKMETVRMMLVNLRFNLGLQTLRKNACFVFNVWIKNKLDFVYIFAKSVTSCTQCVSTRKHHLLYTPLVKLMESRYQKVSWNQAPLGLNLRILDYFLLMSISRTSEHSKMIL